MAVRRDPVPPLETLVARVTPPWWWRVWYAIPGMAAAAVRWAYHHDLLVYRGYGAAPSTRRTPRRWGRGGGGGSAGVREPRRPRPPLGSMGAAAEPPEDERR